MSKKNSGLAMRLYIRAHTTKIKLFKMILYKINRVINACEVPASAEIDETVKLLHNGLGCVIHENAKIGKETIICQNVTIGGRGVSGTPIIGNSVFIGCGACILGGVKIGDRVRIGANAVVICDVPSDCTAVGVPARVIKRGRGN